MCCYSYLNMKPAFTNEKVNPHFFIFCLTDSAIGRLFGTLGSGFLYTLVGDDYGDLAGSDAVAGLAACFMAGTVSSLLAALITFKIEDHESGLKCGPCLTIVPAKEVPTSHNGEEGGQKDLSSPPKAVEAEKDDEEIETRRLPAPPSQVEALESSITVVLE
jgi:hypothetical protein